MKEQPNYFGVLPAVVRYEKTIPDFAKVLFAEVTALSNKWGYCNAKNSTLAELFGKSESTVSKTLSILDKIGFLKVDIERNHSGTFRKIYPMIDTYGRKQQGGLSKTTTGVLKNEQGGLSKNAIQKNSTSNNNTSNNKNTLSTHEGSNSSDLKTKSEAQEERKSSAKKKEVIPPPTNGWSQKLKDNFFLYWQIVDEKLKGKYGETQVFKRVRQVESMLSSYTVDVCEEAVDMASDGAWAKFYPKRILNDRERQKVKEKKDAKSKLSNNGKSMYENYADMLNGNTNQNNNGTVDTEWAEA